MKWSDTFATGVRRIDDQHKMLFAMAADFRAALDESRGERVYAGLLQSLELYVVTHFSYEEGCMARFVCPVAADNKAAHLRFMAILNDFNSRFAAHGYDAVDARNLVDTLEGWLANHICQIDVKMRPWVPTE
jgi:hemerythrin-like metal-binding protein